MLDAILDGLEAHRTRATYAAVAGLVGASPQGMGRLLGERSPRKSWVVSARTGAPTGYLEQERDPNLFENAIVITTSEELADFLHANGVAA